jgi:hypothetical protein
MRQLPLACLVAALVLGGSGCSWFHAKDKPATAPTAAEAPDVARQEPTAAEPIQGPATVALDFLEMHQRLGNSGLPQRDAMAAYDAFLCPTLSTSIRAAQVRQELARAEQPEEKPPLVEGDLFSSLSEGPERFEVRDTAIEGSLARVIVAMGNGEGDKATRWKDTLLLQLDDGIWCLADVEYGGDWPFANKGRLSTMLSP